MSSYTDFSLESPAFSHLETIPAQFTCEGDDEAPQLLWYGCPQSTRSFALIVDDPDAPDPAHPQKTHVHCVIYNIPGNVHELPRGFDPLPEDAVFGTNDWGRQGYGGPCPPVGAHRYFFKIFALDDPLDLPAGATKAEVERAMDGHILGRADLIGIYEKQHRAA